MTNVRNKLRRTGVKVTAWVLLFVTLFAAVGGTVLTAEMQEYGLYAAALQKKEKISYIGTSYWENHFLSMTARVEEMAQAIVHLEQQEELYLTDVMDNPLCRIILLSMARKLPPEKLLRRRWLTFLRLQPASI
ncbi:MAG: hypothetical protein IKM54_01045, partial [Butyricicoccus sp.]|nr:hypothetical protein [Butyricicoccus sp.]